MFLAIQNHTPGQPVSSLSKLKLRKGERKAARGPTTTANQHNNCPHTTTPSSICLFRVSSGSSKRGERERENKRERRGGGVVQSCVAVRTKRTPRTQTKKNRPKRKRVIEIGDETGDLEGQTRKQKTKNKKQSK
jgi:hypothetical protein